MAEEGLEPVGPGLFGEDEFDWATMWTYAFMTFLILTVGYAVLRVGHRAYTSESEAKTALKKRFKGLFGQDEEAKEGDARQKAEEDRKRFIENMAGDSFAVSAEKPLDEENKGTIEPKSYLKSAASSLKSGMGMLKDKLSRSTPVAATTNYSELPGENSQAGFGSKATGEQRVWGPGETGKQQDEALIALDDQTYQSTEDQPVALLPLDLDDGAVEINLMDVSGKTKQENQIDSTSKGTSALQSFMSNFTSSSPASALPQQMDAKPHRMADPAL